MRCPKCGLELRVKERTADGRVLLICINPKCDNSGGGRIVAEK